MRIAVFAKKTIHHKYGGMETQNQHLCEGLVKRGHEVVVFSPKYELADTEKNLNGVKYVYIDSEYRYFLSSTNKNSWFNKSYEAFKQENEVKKFDCAISQSSAGTGIIERKKEIGIKVVSIAHGSAMGEFKTFFMNNHAPKDTPKVLMNLQYALRQFFGRQRQFILHSDKVIAVSEAVKKQLEDEVFPPDGLITVIHNGIEPFDLDAKTPMRSKKLMYVGQVSRDKGVEIFIEMARDIRFKDFEIDVVGDGPLLKDLKLASVDTDNAARLNVLGRLAPQEVIVKKLQSEKGAIFLFPTRRLEGLPMVLIEAMFAGMPIVAYNIGGVSDAVSDGKTGYLVKFGDSSVFKAKVLELALDPVKINMMSKNARETAEKHFSLDIMLDKYEEVLK